jgi:hypothetical protein
MNVYTPSRLDVTLNPQEEKVIKDCMDTLVLIQKKMYEFNCSILADFNGETITYGEIDDILANFERLLHVVEMYDG